MGSVKPMFRNDLRGVDAYTRHKKLIRDYVLHYGRGAPPPKAQIPSSAKTEYDIIREHHRFVRSDDEDDEQQSWEQRVAKKYYDKLFKEYAICELKYYKEGKIALRWRTEREVILGKGQFICGSTRCDDSDDLESWEVNFGYMEHGEKKNELVKVRLCPDCSYKLNYKQEKRAAKENKKRRRSRSRSTTQEDRSKSKRRRRHSNEDEEDQKRSSSEEPEKEDERSIWSKPIEQKQEKSKEEEFEDYFADLLQ
ncbi:protein fra10ac1 homolog [Lichtheimia corymbifera JMRC:FSU:9682]|uniref:Protein fra10ac1 homolog n=1 Tax=Lichtheimia corymbifera JMRC:FSU:9682 TaxID=1263082 RepID=A0A068RJ32_9FUNG|nr:protein fra10ac1 homolog [Lichtheimia corymbifera JMRC:FSU:9682]